MWIDNLIEKKCEEDCLEVSKQIRDEILTETGVDVSAQTIHRYVVERGLFRRVPKE